MNTCIRRDLLIVLLACVALFFVGLGTSGLIDPGDGYYTEGAREMIESGNYIVPHLNYQIYFSKPILIFWLVAAAYKIFGMNEFAGRFWPALSASILAFAVYALTRQLANRRAALTAALIFIASPLVITFARMAMIDMVLSALLGAAVWAFINAVFFEKKYWWMVLYAALALGFLIKGPVAPLLFLFCAGVFVLLVRPGVNELKKTVRLLHPYMGAVLFGLIVVPWCAAVSVATGGLFLKVFLWFENVSRFLGHVNHKHPELWFYLPAVIYGFFPWAICLPAALNDAFRCRLIRRDAKSENRNATLPTQGCSNYSVKAYLDYCVLVLRGFLLKTGCTQKAHGTPHTCPSRMLTGYGNSTPAEKSVLFLACWSLCVLIFFSLAKAKLETYILPCWFSFAILAGIWLANIAENAGGKEAQSPPRSFVFLSAMCLISAAIIPAAAVSAWLLVTYKSSLVHTPIIAAAHQFALVTAPVQLSAVAGGAIILCCGWFCQWFLLRRARLRECLACMILSAVLSCAVAAPAAAMIMYKLKAADLDAVVIKGRGLKLAIFQEFKPSLMFYARQPIDSFFAPGQLVRVQPETPAESKPQYVITSDKFLPWLKAVHGDCFQLVYKKGVWGLYLAQGLTLVHLPRLEQTFRQDLDLNVGDYHWGTLPFAAGSD